MFLLVVLLYVKWQLCVCRICLADGCVQLCWEPYLLSKQRCVLHCGVPSFVLFPLVTRVSCSRSGRVTPNQNRPCFRDLSLGSRLWTLVNHLLQMFTKSNSLCVFFKMKKCLFWKCLRNPGLSSHWSLWRFGVKLFGLSVATLGDLPTHPPVNHLVCSQVVLSDTLSFAGGVCVIWKGHIVKNCASRYDAWVQQIGTVCSTPWPLANPTIERKRSDQII